MDSRIILVRYDEIGLKGNNQKFFIKCLVNNIRDKLSDLKLFRVRSPRGRIFIDLPLASVDEAVKRLIKISGISSFSVGVAVERNFQKIADCGIQWITPLLKESSHLKFCVRTQRSDKSFYKNSMECDFEIGSRVMKALRKDGLSVNINNSDFILQVEIGVEETVVFSNRHSGLGGLPVGCAGPVLSLLSGGIDSPVASFMLMKRGCQVHFIFFENRNFLGRGGYDKVVRLGRILNTYQQGGKLFVIPFEKIQVAIRDRCRQENRIVLYRRMMYRIAEAVADQNNMLGLITGESLGQVASQTLENLSAVSKVVSISVFRPLIGMDKREIVNQAKRIGTFSISTDPHPDCCSVFMPSNPATRSKPLILENDESNYPWEQLRDEAIQNMATVDLKNLN